MSFYPGPELAQLRQAELLEEAANERLARSAREGHHDEAPHRTSVGRLVAVVTTVALLVLAIVIGFDGSDAIQTAGLGGPRG